MGLTGKRSRSHRDQDGDGKYQRRRTDNKDEPKDNELIVYRILCPDGVIGSVIGKSGKVINAIRQDTRAKIKVVDPFPGAKERVITIYCFVKDKENVEVNDDINEDMEPLCPAQDALLQVHAAIANAVSSVGDSDKKRKDKEEVHIIVPTSQAANLIGKSGATIKRLRNKSRANIKVTPKDASDPTHSCAMDFDNFVLITGDAEAVKKALYAVSAIMYKFSPREEISLDTTVPEATPSIIIPSDVPIYPAGGFYPGADPRSLASILSVTSHVPDLHKYTDKGSTWPVYSSGLPIVSGYSASSQSEELIVRLLCPCDKIGRVIGKSGSSIKSVRQATGARVEVEDTKKDRDECIITVISTESPDDLKSMAVEAVLLLQGKINDDDGGTVSIRFLVPSKIIGCIIGKSGSIINEIRKRTKADVRISKGKKPKCANDNDKLVEVIGEVSSVRDALVQIVLRLRDDALKDRDGAQKTPHTADSLYSSGASLSVPTVLPSIPPVTPVSYDQRVDIGGGLGPLSSSSVYGYGSLSAGENGYGSISKYPSKPYSGLLAPSTLEMLIPANAVGKVLGRGGANVVNIRKISGAIVEILDSKSSRGDRVAHISGTPEEKRAAENLIQAFIMAT
ncbi:K Homology domain [Macleaya cordata]|uniref:K Homology domain n=1 Tax=Macleaya cordata TaxID=56857 RepID=A0A200QC44_MACCD|nr:K Homology domain [Macleaya cordata]